MDTTFWRLITTLYMLNLIAVGTNIITSYALSNLEFKHTIMKANREIYKPWLLIEGLLVSAVILMIYTFTNNLEAYFYILIITGVVSLTVSVMLVLAVCMTRKNKQYRKDIKFNILLKQIEESIGILSRTVVDLKKEAELTNNKLKIQYINDEIKRLEECRGLLEIVLLQGEVKQNMKCLVDLTHSLTDLDIINEVNINDSLENLRKSYYYIMSLSNLNCSTEIKKLMTKYQEVE